MFLCIHELIHALIHAHMISLESEMTDPQRTCFLEFMLYTNLECLLPKGL